MLCPKDHSKMKCTNTDPKQDGSIHRRYVCPKCKKSFGSLERLDSDFGLLAKAAKKVSEGSTVKALKAVVGKLEKKPPLVLDDNFEDFEDDEMDDPLDFDDEDLDESDLFDEEADDIFWDEDIE